MVEVKYLWLRINTSLTWSNKLGAWNNKKNCFLSCKWKKNWLLRQIEQTGPDCSGSKTKIYVVIAKLMIIDKKSLHPWTKKKFMWFLTYNSRRQRGCKLVLRLDKFGKECWKACNDEAICSSTWKQNLVIEYTLLCLVLLQSLFIFLTKTMDFHFWNLYQGSNYKKALHVLTISLPYLKRLIIIAKLHNWYN